MPRRSHAGGVRLLSQVGGGEPLGRGVKKEARLVRIEAYIRWVCPFLPVTVSIQLLPMFEQGLYKPSSTVTGIRMDPIYIYIYVSLGGEHVLLDVQIICVFVLFLRATIKQGTVLLARALFDERSGAVSRLSQQFALYVYVFSGRQ